MIEPRINADARGLEKTGRELAAKKRKELKEENAGCFCVVCVFLWPIFFAGSILNGVS
jgi:hypothetical protein